MFEELSPYIDNLSERIKNSDLSILSLTLSALKTDFVGVFSCLIDEKFVEACQFAHFRAELTEQQTALNRLKQQLDICRSLKQHITDTEADRANLPKILYEKTHTIETSGGERYSHTNYTSPYFQHLYKSVQRCLIALQNHSLSECDQKEDFEFIQQVVRESKKDHALVATITMVAESIIKKVQALDAEQRHNEDELTKQVDKFREDRKNRIKLLVYILVKKKLLPAEEQAFFVKNIIRIPMPIMSHINLFVAAFEYKAKEIIKFMLPGIVENSVLLHYKDQKNNSLLHTAVCYASDPMGFRCVHQLIQAGLDVFAKNDDGCSSWQLLLAKMRAIKASRYTCLNFFPPEGTLEYYFMMILRAIFIPTNIHLYHFSPYQHDVLATLDQLNQELSANVIELVNDLYIGLARSCDENNIILLCAAVNKFIARSSVDNPYRLALNAQMLRAVQDVEYANGIRESLIKAVQC